jgi:hypothetical protein
MTAAGGTADSARDRGASARWSSLCERSNAIELGANRHKLRDTWQELRSADAGRPDLLEAWEQLDREIRECDEFVAEHATRSYDGEGAESDPDEADEWDTEGDEFACPLGRCDRQGGPVFSTARRGFGLSQGSLAAARAPRCRLFDRAMSPRQRGPER